MKPDQGLRDDATLLLVEEGRRRSTLSAESENEQEPVPLAAGPQDAASARADDRLLRHRAIPSQGTCAGIAAVPWRSHPPRCVQRSSSVRMRGWACLDVPEDRRQVARAMASLLSVLPREVRQLSSASEAHRRHALRVSLSAGASSAVLEGRGL